MCALLGRCSAEFAGGDARYDKRILRGQYPFAPLYGPGRNRHSRGGGYQLSSEREVAIEAPYKNGKLDGVFKSYFENGKLWQTIGYKNGIEEGVSTVYFENGSKKSKEIYHGGILDGLTEEWDDQGKLRRKLPYMRGQLHGVAKVFDDLGGLKEEMTFDKGLREGPYRRYNRGVKVLEAEFQQNRCVKGCDF